MTARSASVPAPSTIKFQSAIVHPELWLWDSWLIESAGETHLYCLALNRTAIDGSKIEPNHRNDFKFHVRHFSSKNNGRSWTDEGSAFGPGHAQDGSDKRNVWSGSVHRVAQNEPVLYGYTGLREVSSDRHFVQTICLGLGPSFDGPSVFPKTALSDPIRDYESIKQAGYYLGEKEALGNNQGEEGGPIMAWRDPFIFTDQDDVTYMFWSAKIGPKMPSVAWAKLENDNGEYRLGPLQAPITLPDANELTQAEVPKIYKDTIRGIYYMLISSCDRLYEGQPDDEVSKELRLYKSLSLAGPWQPYDVAGSVLKGLDHLFGASVYSADFETGDIDIVAPYTEMATTTQQLSFAPIVTINIYSDESDLEASVSA